MKGLIRLVTVTALGVFFTFHLSAAVLYVDINSTNPAVPYASWSTAATNIQDAVDAASTGDSVVVSNGIYSAGGRAVFGAATNRLTVDKALTVQSVNGADVTVINGGAETSDTIRCVYLANSAKLIGFTLTNGLTPSSGDLTNEQSGGGVWCASAATVQDCVLAGNSAAANGGGAYQGTLTNCTLIGNTSGNGGGAFGGTLTSCFIGTNSVGGFGGGACSNVLLNCTLSANHAWSGGGGANGCTLSNCVVVANYVDGGNNPGGGVGGCVLDGCTLSNNVVYVGPGGGAEASVLRNCVLSANFADYGGGGADGSTLTNCTLTSNHTGWYGGGASFCTLDHCVLSSNSTAYYGIAAGGGAEACTLNNCTLIGNTADGNGGGACSSILNDCVITGNSAPNGGGVNGSFYNFPDIGSTLDGCVVTGNSATQNGGGVQNCTVVNCTLTGNSAGASGGGADASTLTNCIVYYNSALAAANYNASVLDHCCTLPLPTGSGNITNEPQLADFEHISALSPCRGAGNAAAAHGVDIDGETWLNPPSIGCDEFYPSSVAGALSVSLSVDYTNCASGFDLHLIGQIAGHAASCVWNLGDGTVLTNQLYLTHHWTSGGDYDVTFTAFNDSNPAGVGASVLIHIVGNATYYVSLGSAAPAAPFNSWETAATNIQDAVDAAVVGGTVLVSNGVYTFGGRATFGFQINRVSVEKPINVRSLNGAAVTAIQGYPVPGASNAVRCIYLTNGAALAGFTLTNGATQNYYGDLIRDMSGGAIFCESQNALVTDCIVAGNAAGWNGGGVYQGTLKNCTFSNNTAYNGGGACNSVVTNCTFTGNTAVAGAGACSCTLVNCALVANSTYDDSDHTSNGGGASGGTLVGCLVRGNTSLTGGGVSAATLVNCTVIANSANGGSGGVNSCTLTNCIVYYNHASSGTNYSVDSTFDHCDTTPLPPLGTNNITGDPKLADFEHISSGSPCRGAGNATATSGTDIDGDAWLNPPSIGCDEFYTSSSTGALAVAFSATFTNVATGFVVDVTANISGHATASRWDFGDGVTVSNELFVSHAWSAPGNYTITLTAFNADNPGGAIASTTMFVLNNPVHYVSLGSANPTAPFTSWATAATNIQDAVDAAFASGTVMVSNGVYQSGTRVLYGTSTNRVAVTKPLTLQSVNGAAATIIDGGNSVRCLYLTNHDSATGFTLRNGTQANGGGVLCESSDDILSDCVLIGNSSPPDFTSGGGANGGVFNRCTFTGNSCSYNGGGAVNATLNSCVLTNNGRASYGGAAANCTLNNCLVAGNTAAWGGALSGCTINNSVVAGNAADVGGGGAGYFATFNNCTIVSNSAPSGPGTYGGAGLLDGAAFNCVVYYNNGPNYTADIFGLTLDHCCTTPDPGGAGNITAAPLFINLAAGDFHLQTNSPCINSGNNANASGANDLDGNPRIAGGTVDIGAYEYQTPTSVISYGWLQQYGLPVDGSKDFADSDHDGMNNWQEWVAGTSPTDPLSTLKMLPPVATTNSTGVLVSWQSVAARTYYLQRGTTLTAQPAFTTLQSNIVGQAGSTTYLDTTATNAGPYFYRVGVQ